MVKENGWAAEDVVQILSGYSSPSKYCPIEKPKCKPDARYRTFDGSCNNIKHSWWGRANTPYQRLLDAVYDDEISEPRMRGHYGEVLPNPRVVAAKVYHLF
jgi:hypothetical protein